jgi:FkbM family methyltransferase
VVDLYFSLPGGFRVNLGNDLGLLYVIHEIFYKGSYDWLNIQKSGVVLDCGANVGLFTLRASMYTDKIVAVEPLEANYMLLLDNIRTNCLTEHIKPIRKAVFSETCERKLCIARSGAWASLTSGGTRYQKTQCTTVDSLEKYTGFKFDVLKIDVEGAEVEALVGSNKTLDHVRGVALEYHSDELRRKCEEILHALDFEVSELVPHHGLG